MAAESKNSILTVQIKHGRRVLNQTLRHRDRLTIGRSPENDVVVYGESYPRTHTLIECGPGRCRLNLRAEMSGEISYKDSTLQFSDLFLQELLPKKGKSHTLSFSRGRSGVVRLGETEIAFNYDGAAVSAADFPSYTWRAALKRSLFTDLTFKNILALFIIFELLFIALLTTRDIAPPPPPDVASVPKRFAKFVVQQTVSPQTAISSTTAGQPETADESQGEAERETQSRNPGRSGGGGSGKPVGSQGLLGLIGGSGSSAHSSSAVDFLLDQGLVQELDQLLDRGTFVKNDGIGRAGEGPGSGPGGGTGTGDDLDDLLAFGLSGGIDDLVVDVSGVEKVELEKKGQVNISKPRDLRGSQAARGYRNSESVMRVINSQQGRMMYVYNKYLRSDPNLRGKLSLDITIEANGRISEVKILQSTFPNQDFVRDLIGIVKRLKFEPIPEGSITVNLPLIFNRMN